MLKVSHIDHVHIEVSNRARAAEWYVKTLGLEYDPYFAAWSEHRCGPLILKTNTGRTVVALFERPMSPVRAPGTIAFNADAANFLALLHSHEIGKLLGGGGQPLSRRSLVDHKLCLSIYFCDLDQNPIEITTFERDEVLAQLDLNHSTSD